jgi:eukaryotic-like serine/threonine-protein kinase
MSLRTGLQIGPYEALSLLGSGGMGEVYLAKDHRLGRDVAIKILPAEFTKNEERVKRFQKEAKTASSLNHPNIITIYDVGQIDSSLYIVMEYIEGKTLRELLDEGPLSLRRTVSLAAQFADGLAKAHSVGIVHRDLKPENLMITRDGYAKILDFGLAKLIPTTGDQLETVADSAHTGDHKIMGTVGYMSPEQAAGRTMDFRTDQFSFGSILYEMLTGKRAFQGKTPMETLASVIHKDPETLNPSTPIPSPLKWIVERCLAKDPEERYASTRDLSRDLARLRDHVAELSSTPEITAQVERPTVRRLPKYLWIGIPLLLLFLSTFLFVKSRSAQTAATKKPQEVSFTRLTYRQGTVYSGAFAPDGTTIIFSASWQGEPRNIFLKHAEGVESLPINIPDADVLSISKSGQMLVATKRTDLATLSQIPVTGGTMRELLNDVFAASWAPDGQNFVVSQRVNGKTQLQFPAGTKIYETSQIVDEVKFSPNGELLAFVEHIWGGSGGNVIIADKKGKVLARSPEDFPNGIAWTPNGNEVWYATYSDEPNGGYVLKAVNQSGKVRIVESFQNRPRLFDISPNGEVLLTFNESRVIARILAPGSTEEKDISWLDASQTNDITKDGKIVLLHERGEAGENPLGTIYFRKSDGSSAVRLAAGTAITFFPSGDKVLGTNFPCDLYVFPLGAGQTEKHSFKLDKCLGVDVAENNEDLLIMELGNTNKLYIGDLKTNKLREIPGSNVVFESVWAAHFSPDGKKILELQQDGKTVIYQRDGGKPVEVPWVKKTEIPFQWSADGNSVFVGNPISFPVSIYKMNINNGERTLLKTLAPPDQSGIGSLQMMRFSADEKSYVYSYAQDLSKLYLLRHLK